MQPSVLSNLPNKTVAPGSFNNAGSSGGGVAGAPDVKGAQVSKSGLSRFLPTIGGIGGGSAALAIGGALAPETAGLSLLPALGLAALGGGLGGGLGKVAENATEHQDLASGVPGSVLSNAAGNLAGEGMGRVGGAILGKIAPNVLDRIGSGLFQGQFDKNLPGDAAKTLYNMGARTDKEVGQIANVVTGANGAFPQAIKQGLADAEDAGHVVDMTGITDTAANELGNHLGINDNVIRRIGSAITDAINNTARGDVQFVPGRLGKPGTFIYTPGVLKNANPTTVFGEAQKLERMGYGALSKATDNFGNVINDNNYAIGKTLTATAKDMMNRVMGSSGAQLPLSDTVRQTLIDGLSKVKDINPSVYESLVSSLPENLQGLRAVQAPFVQGSKALQALGAIQDRSAGLQAGDLFKTARLPASVGTGAAGAMLLGPAGAAAGILPMVTNPNIYERVGAQGASMAADALKKPIVQKLAPLLSRIGAVTAANLPNDIAAPSGGAVNGINTSGGANMNAGNTMEQNPTYQLYQTLLAQEQASPYNFASSLGPVLNQLAPTLQRQELAAPVINNLLNTYAGAGGAQGMGGGLLSRLTGFIPGTPANTFQKQQSASAAALAPLLGISPEQAQAMFPQLMQTPQAAAPQVGGLQSVLGGIAIPAQ